VEQVDQDGVAAIPGVQQSLKQALVLRVRRILISFVAAISFPWIV
jgi:hypothetical protein